MTDHRFTDRAPIKRLTNDGFLVAEAFVARAGIQLYRGAEVGLVDRDMVRVWRPESEVKSPASVRTYSHAPITLGHPTVMVGKDNWKDLAKGEVSTEAEWKDGKLRLPLIVKDAAAIAAIESGTRELSAGYTCRLEFADGVTPEGEAYDAIQRDIRINHLAIVERGRAGQECRIGDGADASWGATPITHDQKDAIMADAIQTRTVLIDGLSVVTTDAGAQAIEKLQKTISDMAAKAKEEDEDAKKKFAAKETEMAKKDAEIADLKAKALDDAAIDKLVKDRADVIARAKAVHPDVVTDGKSLADIKKAVVIAKRGAEMADKAEAYIDAAFDLLQDAKADPVKGAALADAAVGLDAVYAERNKNLNDAWKAPVNAKKEA